MIAALIIGGLVGGVILAILGKSQIEAAFSSSTATLPDVELISSTVNDNTIPYTSGDENIEGTPVDVWKKDGITTDYNTWPSGDAIWDICRAIAIAEGYDTDNAAFRNNNPGDISDGASYFGSEFVDGSNITKFPDAYTGWTWLYSKVESHVNGKSKVFPQSFTITQVAKKYAARWEPWKNIVGRELSVNPDSTSFAQYVGTV